VLGVEVEVEFGAQISDFCIVSDDLCPQLSAQFMGVKKKTKKV